MIEDYFSHAEIAEELDIPKDAVKDLLADKGEWQKADIDKLLSRLAKKITATI